MATATFPLDEVVEPIALNNDSVFEKLQFIQCFAETKRCFCPCFVGVYNFWVSATADFSFSGSRCFGRQGTLC